MNTKEEIVNRGVGTKETGFSTKPPDMRKEESPLDVTPNVWVPRVLMGPLIVRDTNGFNLVQHPKQTYTKPPRHRILVS